MDISRLQDNLNRLEKEKDNFVDWKDIFCDLALILKGVGGALPESMKLIKQVIILLADVLTFICNLLPKRI